MGGDAAAESGAFVGFKEPRLVMAGFGAVREGGGHHTPWQQVMLWHAPGCR